MPEQQYPLQGDLDRIAQWPCVDPRGCLSFIRREWWPPSSGIAAISDVERAFLQTGDARVVRFTTGGYSGNEQVIRALQANGPLWRQIWVASVRDAHYLCVPDETRLATGQDVGFSGSRKGMTPAQSDTFARVMRELRPSRFRHGDCRGSDAQAHLWVRKHLGVPIEGHPGISRHRAYCPGFAVIHTAKATLDRNRDIVESASIVVATPDTAHETRRSGTWTTVRYAKQAMKPLVIIAPDGAVI